MPGTLFLLTTFCLSVCSILFIPVVHSESITRDYVDGPFGQIHIYQAGDIKSSNRPLLLLHPTATSGFFFDMYMQEMAADRYVIATDTPAYGHSDAPLEPPSVSTLANAILTATKELGLKEFDILGYNTGSYLAVEMASQDPKAVGRLILFGMTNYSEKEREELYEAYIGSEPISEDFSYVERYWRSYVANRNSNLSLERGGRLFSERMLSYPRSKWGYHSVFTYDVGAVLQSLNHPTLIVAPKDCQADQHKDVTSLISNAKCVELEYELESFYTEVPGLAKMTRDYLD